MQVSIIILNWNGGAENCIESVRSAVEQDYPNKEIIFVDNGSNDASSEAVKRLFPSLRYIDLEKNLGCPHGRNIGARYATGDLLFFLENDGVWKDACVVSAAVSLFVSHSKLGALYSKVEGYESCIADAVLDPYPAKTIDSGLYLSSSFRGGASVIKRDLFMSNKGFPQDFFRQGEERFLSLLIYNAGYKVAYWPERCLRHKGSDYIGKAQVVLQYNVENNLKTIIRLYPILPALLIGVPKWLVGNWALIKRGLLKQALRVNWHLLQELCGRKCYQRIRLDTFCEVETLRQGYERNAFSPADFRVKSVLDLLVGRLFLRK